MHFLFLSCLKATRLIEKGLYIRLSRKEKIQLTLHKSMCHACRLYDKQTHILDDALKTRQEKKIKINTDELKISIKKNLLKK